VRKGTSLFLREALRLDLACEHRATPQKERQDKSVLYAFGFRKSHGNMTRLCHNGNSARLKLERGMRIASVREISAHLDLSTESHHVIDSANETWKNYNKLR